MSTTHYDAANFDVERANRSAEWTDAGQAEANLLARAQVYATLAVADQMRAVVDAIRDLHPEPLRMLVTSEIPGDTIAAIAEAIQREVKKAEAPKAQCADCCHDADLHDAEDGHCMVGAYGGAHRCDCVGFEAP